MTARSHSRTRRRARKRIARMLAVRGVPTGEVRDKQTRRLVRRT